MTQLKILQEGLFPTIISVSYRLFIFSYFFAGVHFALLGDSTLRCNHREPTLLFVNCKLGAPNEHFRKNICSEDDLRSRIFGTFVIQFLACLPLLGFSDI